MTLPNIDTWARYLIIEGTGRMVTSIVPMPHNAAFYAVDDDTWEPVIISYSQALSMIRQHEPAKTKLERHCEGRTS